MRLISLPDDTLPTCSSSSTLVAVNARSTRAGSKAAPMDAKALRERLGEPLRPLKPQQPLDIGLFEVRPPEAPHILMPDD